MLAPGEIANAKVKHFREKLDKLENSLRKNYGTAWKENPDISRRQLDLIDRHQKILAKAQDDAKKVWSTLSEEYKREMTETREAAKIEGNRRAFARVSTYADNFNAIFATKPADVSEFINKVKADPDLARLQGVDRYLPPGSPSEWKAVIFSKQFWSGQSAPTTASIANIRAGHGAETPDPTLFAPDPTTGQVDMRGDVDRAKPGYTNFDYAVYDENTTSWWHANHRELHDPERPMLIYQSSSDKLFAGSPDHDSSVICIAFVNNSR
ncbi:hypothetical protein AB0B25_16885 [Nocardia sp. NPDC049190]|uniref:hypothetical protein n=1 Tax=Nocardia sp. NPDC049190 TaxID=3155650 RepID=UPI003403E99F